MRRIGSALNRRSQVVVTLVGRTAPAIQLTVLVLLLAPSGASAQTDKAAAPLRALADAARTRMAERVEPPATRIPFLCLAERSRSAPLREYVLRQQAEAVQALLNTATTPAATTQVQRVLAELARKGTSDAAAAWLIEQGQPGAARVRHAAAFGELPAALDARMHPGCGGSYRGLVGRTYKPLGELALTDYQRLAEQEPSDPWTWLALAWLAGKEGEHALQRSLGAARTLNAADAKRAVIFAQQELAWLRQQQGRGAEARAAATEAMQLARQTVDRIGSDPTVPGADQALRDFGQTGNTLAAVLEALGQKSAAQDVLGEVLPLQQRLAAERPDDLAAQYALIDTLLRLALLQTGPAVSATAPTPFQQAQALYQRLQQRAPYDSMMGRSSWPGMFSMAIAAAGVLTLVLGLALLWLFRRRVARLMITAASKPATPAPLGADPEAPAGRPAIELGPPLPRAPGSTSQVARSAAAALRHAAVVQSVAGLAFGAVAAWLELRAAGIEPSLNRVLVMSWTWAWPTVLALGVVWDGDRRRKRLAWAAYFGVLALMSVRIAMGDTPPLQLGDVTVPALMQGFVFWAITLSYSPFLLLFLNRAVRAIGPALLAMMLVATTAAQLALVGVAMPTGFSVAGKLLAALHVPPSFFLPFVMLLGMLVSAPLVWWAGRLLRAAYAAKWLTDQSLTIDAIWLFQAGVLSLNLILEMGPIGWVGLAAFGVHKGVTLVGMWPAARVARRRTPARLLLLRVFGRQRSSERLFDLLGTRWRYAGPIHMIGAPDLASRTINPDEFLDFLAGRLRQRFILEPGDLPARLAALDASCDFDARWRVGELYCGNDTWRDAVRALMARSDVAAMDLRGFGPEKQGCVFELHALLDLVPAQRVALLADASTKMEFLHSTVQACLARMSASSPNALAPGRVTLLDIGGGESAAVEQLLSMPAAL
jgi:tetratricopeptide (TPR) repeat protein